VFRILYHIWFITVQSFFTKIQLIFWHFHQPPQSISTQYNKLSDSQPLSHCLTILNFIHKQTHTQSRVRILWNEEYLNIHLNSRILTAQSKSIKISIFLIPNMKLIWNTTKERKRWDEKESFCGRCRCCFTNLFLAPCALCQKYISLIFIISWWFYPSTPSLCVHVI
jgi:hypothetical protein